MSGGQDCAPAAQKMARRHSLPLEGKVPNGVRRMRWGAERCCNVMAGQGTRGCGVLASCAAVGVTAKARCHLISRLRRQLPLEGKPLVSPKSGSAAENLSAASNQPATFLHIFARFPRLPAGTKLPFCGLIFRSVHHFLRFCSNFCYIHGLK